MTNEQEQTPYRKPLRVRIFRLVLLIVAVIATLFLAKWQWGRFESETGSLQNLGYALQWPTFGAFFIYAYIKLGEYEKTTHETGKSPVEIAQQKKAEEGQFSEIDPDFLPDRPELDIETFNKLNTPRRRRGDHASDN